MNSTTCRAKTRLAVRAMRVAMRDGEKERTAKQWARALGISIAQTYNVAREVGLEFAKRPLTKYPEKINVTYAEGKVALRPSASVPCTAIRAAGLDGERTLKLSVEPNRIIIEKVTV